MEALIDFESCPPPQSRMSYWIGVIFPSETFNSGALENLLDNFSEIKYVLRQLLYLGNNPIVPSPLETAS